MKRKRYLTRTLLPAILALVMVLAGSPVLAAESEGVVCTFSAAGITVAPAAAGCSIEGKSLTIFSGGAYTVTGYCPEGCIRVTSPEPVTLLLQDLSLTNATAPLQCAAGTAVTLRCTGTVALSGNGGISIDVSAGAGLRVEHTEQMLLGGGSEQSLACRGSLLALDASARFMLPVEGVYVRFGDAGIPQGPAEAGPGVPQYSGDPASAGSTDPGTTLFPGLQSPLTPPAATGPVTQVPTPPMPEEASAPAQSSDLLTPLPQRAQSTLRGNLQIPAASVLTITDSAGTAVFTSFAADEMADDLLLVSGELTPGAVYCLYVNGEPVSTAIAVSRTAAAAATVSPLPGTVSTGIPAHPSADITPLPPLPDTTAAGAGYVPVPVTNEPSAWAWAELTSAVNAGLVPAALMQNYQGSVSREAVAEMFVNLVEKASGWSIQSYMIGHGLQLDENAFADTRNPSVLAAHALGLVEGISPGLFAPDAPLTRAELVTILNRAAQVLGVDTGRYSHSFTDVSNHWVNSQLGWAAQTGIIQGTGEGRFDPDGILTTEEIIVITYRALTVLQAQH